MKITAEVIKGVRKRLGETQAEFGARMGIDQATVSRWESGFLPRAGGPSQLLLRRVLQDIERVHPLAVPAETAA